MEITSGNHDPKLVGLALTALLASDGLFLLVNGAVTFLAEAVTGLVG